MADVRPLLPGEPEEVGEIRVAGRLGAGRKGVAYLGYTLEGRSVVVRLIDPGWIAETGGRTPLATRLIAARKVRSSWVAEVIDAQVGGSDPFVVTQFVDGPTLLDAVRLRGPLHGEALQRLAVCTAAGLVAVHDAGLVHGELTPAQVLLGADGPRLIGLGLDGGAAGTPRGRTGAGQPPRPHGTRRPPLQPADDVFAWAASIWFAATGWVPFAGDGPAEDRARLAEWVAAPSPAGVLRGLVRDCLLDEPRQRPTARQVLMRLTGVTYLPRATAAPASVPAGRRPPRRFPVVRRSFADTSGHDLGGLEAAVLELAEDLRRLRPGTGWEPEPVATRAVPVERGQPDGSGPDPVGSGSLAAEAGSRDVTGPESAPTEPLRGARDPFRPHDAPAATLRPETVHGGSTAGEPVPGDPMRAQAPADESVRGEPVRGEPVRREPVRREPVRGEPVPQEPVQPEPVREPVGGEEVHRAGDRTDTVVPRALRTDAVRAQMRHPQPGPMDRIPPGAAGPVDRVLPGAAGPSGRVLPGAAGPETVPGRPVVVTASVARRSATVIHRPPTAPEPRWVDGSPTLPGTPPADTVPHLLVPGFAVPKSVAPNRVVPDAPARESAVPESAAPNHAVPDPLAPESVGGEAAPPPTGRRPARGAVVLGLLGVAVGAALGAGAMATLRASASGPAAPTGVVAHHGSVTALPAAVSGAGPSAAGATCGVRYRVVEQWPGGFKGEVTVTAGAAALQGWTVRWTYGPGQRITQWWDAGVTVTGSSVTAQNASWNGRLAPGASTTFAFLGAYRGDNPNPEVTCSAG